MKLNPFMIAIAVLYAASFVWGIWSGTSWRINAVQALCCVINILMAGVR